MESRKILLIIGKTGTGKSYLTKGIVERAYRVIVLDRNREYDKPPIACTSGYIFYNIESFGEYMTNRRNAGFTALCQFDNEPDFIAAMRISEIVGNCILIIEEVHLYNEGTKIHPVLSRLIRLGRHSGVSLIGVTQRIRDIHPDMRQNSDGLVCFQQINPADIAYLNSFAVVDTANPEELARLGIGEYKFWRT